MNIEEFKEKYNGRFIPISFPLPSITYGPKKFPNWAEAIIVDALNVKKIAFDPTVRGGLFDTNITQEMILEGEARIARRKEMRKRKLLGIFDEAN